MKILIKSFFIQFIFFSGILFTIFGSHIALAQKQVFLNAVLHIGDGSFIPNGFIEINDGKIIKVGPSSQISDTVGKRIFNVKSKHIYPGLIAMNTSIGLTEINAVRATNDSYEIGSLNPNVNSQVAFNIDSDIIPTTRCNGVLLAQITPRGDLISGSSSVMLLDSWTVEEALYKANEGIHLNWPSYYPTLGQDIEKHTAQRLERLSELNLFFDDAKAHFLAKNNYYNLRLDAIKGLFDNTQTLYINAWYAKEIIESVNFAKHFGIKKIAIICAGGCRYILDFLKQNDISIILNRLHALPARSEDALKSVYNLPKELKEAGILFSLCYYGEMEEMGIRNLPFVAGTAANYGLSSEQALESITLSAAKILGIENSVGSLEVNKDATFLISDGDILNMQTNKITHAYIKGKEIDLDNKHLQLYLKYIQKYGLKQ